MIESFGIDKKNVAKWAGLTSAVFSLSQCLTAVLWGRASDKFGRKPTIMVGLTCTMICTLIWGMSTTLPMAIVARALSGACNGNGNSSLTLNSEKNVLTWEGSRNHSHNGSRDGSRERTSTTRVLHHAFSLESWVNLRSFVWWLLCQTDRELAFHIRR